MYKVCLEGLDATVEKLTPNYTCADAHNACQAVIDKYKFTENYRKRTGYSIGISFSPDWGEGNILGLFTDMNIPLQPGMVFHVPVALREFGKFTVAVSETVVITKGAAHTLSKIGRDLVRA
jgi:Xaa-Pro dipeptidase